MAGYDKKYYAENIGIYIMVVKAEKHYIKALGRDNVKEFARRWVGKSDMLEVLERHAMGCLMACDFETLWEAYTSKYRN